MKWDHCFREINTSLVHVTIEYNGGIKHGTAFVLARFKKEGKRSSKQYAQILGTAKHLIKDLPSTENVYITLTKYDIFGNKLKQIKYFTNKEEHAKSPFLTHNDSDVGILFCPEIDKSDTAVPAINFVTAIEPGTRVGFAGFPAFINEVTKKVHPCYFEGVISTVYDDQKGRIVYLIDGHGGPGLSGGPLWIWDDENCYCEVIGVCSKYVFGGDHAKQSLPGIVTFESINPIMAFLYDNLDYLLFSRLTPLENPTDVQFTDKYNFYKTNAPS